MKKKVDAVAKNQKTKTVSKKVPASKAKTSAVKTVKKGAGKATPTKKAAAKTSTNKKTSARKSPAQKAAAPKSASRKTAAAIAATDLAVTLAKKLTQSKKPASTALPQIAPLHHRVVVRPTPRAEKTAGGLYIPESAEHKPLQGTVVAVGLGKVMKKGAVRPMDVQNGDTVLYAPYAGTDVQLEGEQFLILTEDEILGVLND